MTLLNLNKGVINKSSAITALPYTKNQPHKDKEMDFTRYSDTPLDTKTGYRSEDKFNELLTSSRRTISIEFIFVRLLIK